MTNYAISSAAHGSDNFIITLPFGVCSTAAGTAAKTVTVPNGKFSLETGARVVVQFTYANTVANPTLNVQSTGAKAIYWHNAALVSSQYWEAGAILDFVYDGAQWELVGVAKDTDTNYYHTSSYTSANGYKIATGTGVADLYAPAASGTIAGLTIVYPAASCTTFSSDNGTVTPLAVQKGAKMFSITRPQKKDTAETTTDKAITRWQGTSGDVQDSTIIIEDVVNSRDNSEAQVLAIPASGGKKMVYGYCTDQIDGTSFIGGVFDASATEYPYQSGLAIGGTSGNLLWKGAKVATVNDISDTKVTQAYDASTNANIPLLFSATSGITSTASRGATTAKLNNKFYVNPSTGALTATSVYGAVWNDYAEFRESDSYVEPGRVVIEKGDDTLTLATERLQPAGNIVSDTFGFAIGETDKAKTPIAVSGRVLAYTWEPREAFAPGDAVCTGPNGTVSKMTREEIINYPERIIGTVSAVPNYETWGENNVVVNGRIWIKVR